jgi:patatin-related protein
MPDLLPARDDKLDIRLAVVMTGGVSLAIWMSGVTVELLHVARESGQQQGEYVEILDILQATAVIDVISGTSAGGINSAFLALALTHGVDLTELGTLWAEHASLLKMLQNPLEKKPCSLLRGDDYFLPAIRAAMEQVTRTTDESHRERNPIDLILTGTLWRGRQSSFSDDLGSSITEVNYDATFRFSAGKGDGSDLTDQAVIPQLAAAARVTSSFPGAFEPHWVAVTKGETAGGRHVSTAGMANFPSSQYVLDGGILMNKPLRPALQAIHDLPADQQVRRVLAYVVPGTGESVQDIDNNPDKSPAAGKVLLDTYTRLQATQSVSRELADIRMQNERVTQQRASRSQFAAALSSTPWQQLSIAAWPAYQRFRQNIAANQIARLLVTGQNGTADPWSERELVEAIRFQELHFVPSGEIAAAVTRTGAAWDWGQTTVDRLGQITVDILKRAIWLAPLGTPEREAIVKCRRQAYERIAAIRDSQRELDSFWLTTPASHPLPPRHDGLNCPSDYATLENWLRDALSRWDTTPTRSQSAAAADFAPYAARRTEQHEDALGLAALLLENSHYIDKVASQQQTALDPDGDESRYLRQIHHYLLADARCSDQVLRRMLRLDVVQIAFGGPVDPIEQQVDLVQLSVRRSDRLTGFQEHAFGAFYRAPWRINDWLHGRMDGAAQLVPALLHPERLRQLGLSSDELHDRLHLLATGPAGPDHDWLESRWQETESKCRTELTTVAEGKLLPSALPACSTAVAIRIQCGILRAELSSLADAVRVEAAEHNPPPGSTAWLAEYVAKVGRADIRTNVPTHTIWELWESSRMIGEQRIRADLGSDTFAETAAAAATVAANNLTGMDLPLPIRTIVQSVRGYTLTVWALIGFLVRGGRFATRAVQMSLAVGGVLVAIAFVVPAIPLGLTLIGVTLLLAGISCAALRARQPEARRIGWRLLVIAAVAAAAVGWYLWTDYLKSGMESGAVTAFVKLIVAVSVIVLGVWVATAGPKPWWRRRR